MTTASSSTSAVVHRLRSLNQVLDVLEALHRHGPELGVSELGRLLGTSKGAVHAVLSNLEARGYVRRTPGRRYQLGIRLWELGFSVERTLGLRDTARPHLQQLTNSTGESTHLSVYDAGDAVYLDKVSTHHAVQAYTHIGGRAPAYCVATGKCLLAYQDDAEVQRVLADLHGFTEKTLTSPVEMAAQLQDIRLQGYATNSGEWRSDVVGVAAPVKGFTGHVLAAVGVSGPIFRFSLEKAHAAASEVMSAAAAISGGLGHSSAWSQVVGSAAMT